MEKIVLGTSLAPRNIEKQRNAVRSWIDNGFKVISCNIKEEIEVLAPLFSDLDIEFQQVDRSASDIGESPLPYLEDIISIVQKKTERICGYINSDIIISSMTEEMYSFIREETKNSILFVHRYEIKEIKDITKINWKIHFDGIDLFLIDKMLKNPFYGENLFVQSIWDLPLLVKCDILGIPIKELTNPIAFHVAHPTKWDYERYEKMLTMFWNKYFGESDDSLKNILLRYYYILFNRCRQVCYCKNQFHKSLIILPRPNKEMMDSIMLQSYPNIKVSFEADQIDSDYDYIFYLKDNLLMRECFCETVIAIMTQFDCCEMEIGRFFCSMIDGEYMFNELNRSMEIVEEINNKYDSYTRVVNNGSKHRKAKIDLPISYEKVDMGSEAVKKINVSGKIYLMPAGVRASTWIQNNEKKLKNALIAGYIDNDRKKEGQIINGKRVYSIDYLKKDKDNYTIILASKYYRTEIKKQLLEIIPSEKVLDAGYILNVLDNGEIIIIRMPD